MYLATENRIDELVNESNSPAPDKSIYQLVNVIRIIWVKIKPNYIGVVNPSQPFFFVFITVKYEMSCWFYDSQAILAEKVITEVCKCSPSGLSPNLIWVKISDPDPEIIL